MKLVTVVITLDFEDGRDSIHFEKQMLEQDIEWVVDQYMEVNGACTASYTVKWFPNK